MIKQTREQILEQLRSRELTSRPREVYKEQKKDAKIDEEFIA